MKQLLIMLCLCGSALAEPFECMLAITRQDPSMDWWYAVPDNFEPQITNIDAVHKGEYFCILPVFKNYSTDPGGAAGISFNLKLTKPNGKTQLDLKELEGHIGLASTPDRLPAQAVVNLCFDAADDFGDYSVEVTAIDKVSNQTNVQQRVISLQPFETEKLSKEERENLFFSYVTSPAPSKALASFLQIEQSFFNEEKEPIWSAIWFFKTVFERNEFLIPHLLDEYAFLNPKQQKDIIFLLTLLGQTEKLPRLSGDMKRFERLMAAGRIPDPYDDITMPKQLDMLWAEFFATGTVRPLRQIVCSLELIEHTGTLERIQSGELDPNELEVYREGMLEAVFQAALWSLKSNCIQVPLVKQYCIGLLLSDELPKPAAATLAMLLQSLENPSSVDKEKEATNEKDYKHQ
ncbi:hypothetical protein [Pontiella agarivorans]|uniref:Uncharacterized protein n=1 Tax=Pontiella agarivorans TaxID=3038953 RepID=A0ABU5MTP0_9BACT|nr:hypothetical protein [Pontiella agarivorans]MDZ8117589.1 hypothetical protein [Pontiella agarivorans]